jgi:GT2 family glycosyltransferase
MSTGTVGAAAPRTEGLPAAPLPVSVVIPVLNREQQLARALASVARQRRPAAEVIVVDDGSTDGSAGVARQFGARVVAHERNRGQVAARNTGITAARHPWIAFLDSDDEWLPDHLQELWKLRDGVLFVACSSLNCRADPSRDRVVGPLTREPIILRGPWRLVHPQNFVTMSATMVRRDALAELGGFRAHDGIIEDLDLWVRLLSRGSARISPKVSVVYHVHGAQITQDLPRTRGAHLSLADGYTAGNWPASLPARHRGAQAWDELRDALDRRELRSAAERALWIVRSVPRVRGALELLTWRVRARRASARVRRDGLPSIALLVAPHRRLSVPPDLAERERSDLRGRGRGAVLVRIARRPAGLAVVDSPEVALAARALRVPAVGSRSLGTAQGRSS